MPYQKDFVANSTVDQIFLRLVNVLTGLVLWEIFSTCDYEIDALLGRRPYRWTFWIYFSCRASMVVSLVVLAVSQDFRVATNCTAWHASVYALTYLSLGLASSLILLRVIAVWQRNMFVSTTSFLIWLASIVLNIRYVVILRSVYTPQVGGCLPRSNPTTNAIGIIASDITLLIIMIVGVLKHRAGEPLIRWGVRDLWELVWQQGIVWLTVAAIVEVPALVIINLNTKDHWYLIFELITLPTLCISATRMHRTLVEYMPLVDISPVYVTDEFIPEENGYTPKTPGTSDPAVEYSAETGHTGATPATRNHGGGRDTGEDEDAHQEERLA
ncbi:hypothetical protein FA95DRAFT_1603958 [Auriscalpium vulgare]|uniref:Uncharacterized protein n=1 Tax=Auriscalpium vulgare TaxID=40419 RepID=A0ACB8S1F0_9AGAM|nr:hypothetical protein FA95DRAFT_1603958 [Auriscalpium vulgare]